MVVRGGGVQTAVRWVRFFSGARRVGALSAQGGEELWAALACTTSSMYPRPPGWRREWAGAGSLKSLACRVIPSCPAALSKGRGLGRGPDNPEGSGALTGSFSSHPAVHGPDGTLDRGRGCRVNPRTNTSRHTLCAAPMSTCLIFKSFKNDPGPTSTLRVFKSRSSQLSVAVAGPSLSYELCSNSCRSQCVFGAPLSDTGLYMVMEVTSCGMLVGQEREILARCTSWHIRDKQL